MYNVILVRYGEIILKGNNRKYFENKLVENIKYVLKDENVKIIYSQARIFVEPADIDRMDTIMTKLTKVFGIVSVSPAVKTEANMDSIIKTSIELIRTRPVIAIRDCGRVPRNLVAFTIKENAFEDTFKVEARRQDKAFPLTSPEICRTVGHHILENVEGMKVDVVNPKITLNVEVRNGAYIYFETIPAFGGMPVGTNGKGLLLVSGGIDSPVAGFMLAKRGVEIDALHFFSPPYTGPKAKEKVLDLCRIVSTYAKKINLYVVNFTEPQLQIRDNCPHEQLVLLMRRIMMRIAEKVAHEKGCQALITGENIGQVASQTMESIVATNDVVDIPVFRPLIGMDKNEIIDYARKIGTYETSILPYEDCCTVFVPRHPETKPKIFKLVESEKKLDIDKIVEECIDGIETIVIENGEVNY